jgi:Kef-type K+ transport system membrane component KefB
LSGIGSVAVLVFGLITGLHLDPKTFRGNGRAISAVAFANRRADGPRLCGRALDPRPPSRRAGSRYHPLEFAVAFGICIGMTALPVLGALLNEMGLLGRRIGHLALGIAGINDAVLWIVLGLLLTAVAGHAAGGGRG